MSRLEEQLFKEYLQFFEKAERERRWNVFTDIPWERVNRDASEEMATFVIYVKHRERAAAENDECLRTIYDFIARDEIAHCRFYQSVIKVLLDEDRQGTLADMAQVFANFRMPGVGIVPDYDARIL